MANEKPIAHQCVDGGTELLNLNDDSIMAILSHLTPAQYSGLAQTCRRLKGIACYFFELNAANKYYHIHRLFCIKFAEERDSVTGEKYSMLGNSNYRLSPFPDRLGQKEYHIISRHHNDSDIIRYLKSFGHLISEINFHHQFDSNAITVSRCCIIPSIHLFSKVIKYCGGSLKGLTIHGFDWTPEMVAMATPLATTLTKLHLVICDEVHNLLAICNELRELSLGSGIDISLRHFDLSSPHLQILHLTDEFSDYTTEIPVRLLESFLRRHRDLRELRITTPPKFNLAVLGQMQRMNKLHVNGMHVIYEQHESIALEFTQLKELTLKIPGADVSAFVCAVTRIATDSLEYVRIKGATLSDASILALNDLRHLRELELIEIRFLSATSLQLYQKLHELTRLTLVNKRDAMPLLHCPVFQNIGATPSLTHLTLHSLQIDQQCLRTISRCSKLQQLEISYPDLDQHVNMNDVAALAHSRELKTLKLKGIQERNEKLLNCFCPMDSIEVLQISNCTICIYIGDMLRHFNKLRTLDIVNSSIIVDANTAAQMNSIRNISALRCGIETHKSLLNWPSDAVRSLSLRSPHFNIGDVITRFHKLRQLHIAER